ncbi:hypothetical protein GCM10027429_30320 [Marivirga atlantica]|jgi:hypothetical protein|uniref:Uncharacterized protein n=1 Tax=Marivirga atlantica TaxID=1548457 RepID=A0A937AA27_9BACT|nr:hypothetical protein [Marivirga atlantica]MBL0766612.1 hypothetical protein [Marivirga atlantica]
MTSFICPDPSRPSYCVPTTNTFTECFSTGSTGSGGGFGGSANHSGQPLPKRAILEVDDVLDPPGTLSGVCGPEYIKDENNKCVLPKIYNYLENNPCVSGLFYNLLNTNNISLNSILEHFNIQSSGFDYYIKIDETNALNLAQTINDGSYSYITTLNSDYLKVATKLSISRTMIHELIHAYISSYIIGVGGQNPTKSIRAFPILWSEMLSKKYGIPEIEIERYQHEEMARNYVNFTKLVLKQLYGSQFEDQYYFDLAWGGLMGTTTFEQSTVLTSSDKERIIKVNNSEDFNNNSKSSPCLN